MKSPAAGLLPDEATILTGLRAARREENWTEFDGWVVLAGKHPSRAFTEELCAALDHRGPAALCEEIAWALAEIQDPASAGSLRSALYWKPDFDEFGHFAVKVVWALEVKARQVLVEASQAPGWLPWVQATIDEAGAHPRDPKNGYRRRD